MSGMKAYALDRSDVITRSATSASLIDNHARLASLTALFRDIGSLANNYPTPELVVVDLVMVAVEVYQTERATHRAADLVSVMP